MTTAIEVLRCAGRLGWADFRDTYTWRAWLFGWLLRLFAQVAFYGLIGSYFGSAISERYIVIGNCVAVVVLEALIVIVRVAEERAGGTLSLLVASPSSHLLIYLGRGVPCVVMGFLTSTTALFVVPRLLGVDIPVSELAAVLPVLFVIGVSGYLYGCALAAFVVRYGAAQWLVMNIGYMGVLTFCGVNVPITDWPLVLRILAGGLPLSHGLDAVRGYLDGGSAALLLTGAAAELAVAGGWLVVAIVLFDRMAEGGRRDGTLEFGE